jgi:hypothetical protein
MRVMIASQRRSGNVLILFALLTFALFAVAGITIDLGFARLAQRQMQGATDSAALEGLRYRDGVPPWLADPNSDISMQMQQDGVSPANPDQVRRWMARNMVNLTFTNSVDPTTGNPIQFGAGPAFQLSGGIGDANALQTINTPSVSTVTVYRPNLQLNFGNQKEGDLVAGNLVIGALPAETTDYTRSDFMPAAAGSSPPPDAFLVRLRRTQDTYGNDRNALDNQPSVSTTGPALPLLFAQGSLVAGVDPSAGYSPRHHGITVRGTSIAKARPALAVGQPIPKDATTNGMFGVGDFFIKLSDWQSATTFDSSKLTAYAPISTTRTFIVVGDAPTSIGRGAMPSPAANKVYVPLMDDATSLVAGFGFVASDGTILTKTVPMIAPENATASAAVYRPNDPSIPDPHNAAVLSQIKGLVNNANPAQFLLAPALVR